MRSRLSQAWYGDRLDRAYGPKSRDVLQGFPNDVGLREDFWSLLG